MRKTSPGKNNRNGKNAPRAKNIALVFLWVMFFAYALNFGGGKLNGWAIAANGGTMPAVCTDPGDRALLEKVQSDEIQYLGSAVHVFATRRTKLVPLVDRFSLWLPPWAGDLAEIPMTPEEQKAGLHRIVSVGDLFVYVSIAGMKIAAISVIAAMAFSLAATITRTIRSLLK